MSKWVETCKVRVWKVDFTMIRVSKPDVEGLPWLDDWVALLVDPLVIRGVQLSNSTSSLSSSVEPNISSSSSSCSSSMTLLAFSSSMHLPYTLLHSLYTQAHIPWIKPSNLFWARKFSLHFSSKIVHGALTFLKLDSSFFNLELTLNSFSLSKASSSDSLLDLFIF